MSQVLFLNADFFADSLSEAYTLEEDPMGEQKVIAGQFNTYPIAGRKSQL